MGNRPDRPPDAASSHRFDPSKFIHTDTWPIVEITVPEHIDAMKLDLMFRYIRKHADWRGPHLALVDTTRIDLACMDARMRSESARLYKKYSPAIRRVCIAEAMVLPSTIHRALFRAIQWVAPSDWPIKCFPSKHEARRWLTEQYNARLNEPLNSPPSLAPRVSIPAPIHSIPC